MRWTRSLISTIRDDPADAETISHKLMVRAGMIRKLTSGVYSYLPLGQRSLLKVMTIIREEMNRAGAQELLMPVLHPAELWQETGRLETFGPLMCKFKDRNDRLNVLGPTHEEVITHIVRGEINSYKQLPVTLYQIQTKFRDEVRPRFGVIRSREFIMKDAYSFDADAEGMGRSYQAQYDAYRRIFTRCGLKHVIVEADTGLMGGDVSHEFVVPSPSGEGVVVSCPCGYAASAEQAVCPPRDGGPPNGGPSSEGGMDALTEVATPGKSTVEDVAAFLGATSDRLIKTMIVMADGKAVAALVRGDHELNISKLGRLLKADAIDLATPEQIGKTTGGPIGFSGPVGLKIRIVADHAVRAVRNGIVGANRGDAHMKNVNHPRDFAVETWADIRNVAPGDACPSCGKPLAFANGIEVGQVFKLGVKYSAKMKAHFLDEKGVSHPMWMGCYGIGVNRIVASAIECSNDANGIVWPMAIAPCRVHLVSVNQADENIRRISGEIYDKLNVSNMDILWDDREVSPGVKFKDADLIGIPVRVTVGGRTLKAKTVDVKLRNREGETAVPLDGVMEGIDHAIRAYSA